MSVSGRFHGQGKLVSVLQPAYFPWLGYFHLIRISDVFVFFDDVQFARWFTNRNKIRTGEGWSWISTPVKSHRSKINETLIDYSHEWRRKHLDLMRHNYQKAPHYTEVMGVIENVLKKDHQFISDLAIDSVQTLSEKLGIETRFEKSSNLNCSEEDPSKRLLNLCKILEADIYCSGPRAKDYLNTEIFEKSQMSVKWHEYQHPIYKQMQHTDFLSHMSILDAVMNCGFEVVSQMIR